MASEVVGKWIKPKAVQASSSKPIQGASVLSSQGMHRSLLNSNCMDRNHNQNFCPFGCHTIRSQVLHDHNTMGTRGEPRSIQEMPTSSKEDPVEIQAPLNHWWEAPSGLGCDGKPVTPPKFSSLNTVPTASPTQSDVTFEGGVGWNYDNVGNYDAESAPKSSLEASQRDQNCIEKLSGSTGLSGTLHLHPLESPSQCWSQIQSGELGNNNNKWSEEERKMMIGSHILSAIFDEAALQKRISELRVSLQASESARLENAEETEALRKYLANVEAAAAGLQVRVQELEQQLTSISSMHETRELDKLRAKLAMEASKEVRIQAATAAQAVAAARESTMELDKVKRHASALLKAQEEEIERLRIEATECRTLNHAKSAQIQELKSKIAILEDEIKQQCKLVEQTERTSQGETKNLLKQSEEENKADRSNSMEAQAKDSQYAELLEAFEFTKNAAQAAEKNLEENEKEKKELKSHNDWLEQKVAQLQNREASAATVVHCDHELCKVRAVLGYEKQHLLAELAMLHQGNQILEGDLVEWQEKFHALSCQLSGLYSTSELPSIRKSTKDSLQPTSLSMLNSGKMGKYYDHQSPQAHCKICAKGICSVSECRLGNSRGIESNAGSSCTGKENMKVFGKVKVARSNVECCSEIYSDDGGVLQEASNRSVSSFNIHPTGDGNKSHEKSLMLRDNLLAAAHKEIVKLREINQCLVRACKNKFKMSKQWRDLIRKEVCIDE